MIIGPPSERPVEFAIAHGDRQIVDVREASLHQAGFIIFPILVAVGPEPVAAVVMPFIGIADRDPVAIGGP